MSFKVKLSERLPDFPLNVKFQLPNGVEAEIKYTVKHLKASEIQELYARENVKDHEFITEIASGWDLEDEFTPENAQKLVDKFPAAALALTQSYMAALAGVRVKN
ncbi:putative tape measure chaperone protein [Klebsiella phage vB_KaeD_HazelMika]|nr:putative tape measure chaperone protein [Klebsiella phage vB_KaeD_HazelMika]